MTQVEVSCRNLLSVMGQTIVDPVIGPDGNLYVADDNSILRYNGTTGAFMNAFVSAASGGLNYASGIAFGPDGNLYVGSWGTDEVKGQLPGLPAACERTGHFLSPDDASTRCTA